MTLPSYFRRLTVEGQCQLLRTVLQSKDMQTKENKKNRCPEKGEHRFVKYNLSFLFIAQCQAHNGQLAVDGSVKGDDTFASSQPQRLQLVVNDVEQVMVVGCI